jgi:alpha-mannosidase
VHPGTQYFKYDTEGVVSNLLMREWESYFSGEYGWPRYAEYRHALLPHGGNITNSERLRAASGFSQKLITVIGQPQTGRLAARKSFITMGPDNVQLLAFRKKERRGYELRVLEVEGKKANASIELAIPTAAVTETNLLGEKVAEVASSAGKLEIELDPWKVRTFEVL